ncbi:MAG: hypothetical protein ACSHYA_04390 [Opitutaceae bacterium]
MKISRIPEAIALAALLLVLGGIFIPTVSSTAPNPERIITKMTVSRLQQAVEMYRGEYATYPKLQKKKLLAAISGENLRGIEFWAPKKTEKRFLRSTIQGDLDDSGELIDGWSNPFLWKASEDGQILTLISTGKNGVYDHEKEDSDDIHFPIIKPLLHGTTKAEPVVSRQ